MVSLPIETKPNTVCQINDGHNSKLTNLLGQLRDSESPILLAAPGCEGGKSGHEEVQPREGHHVGGQLAKVGVQLAGESQAGRDPCQGEKQCHHG